MQLKRQKNKGSFANGRGKRVMVFLKRVLLAMSLIAVAAIIVLSIRLADTLFPLQKVIVTGNKNLEEERIKDVMDTGNEKGLLRISLKDVDRKLKTLPWIKKAALRKQFPDAIMINVEESVPMAILDYNGGLFMIDGGGSILEEIKEEKTPFLPVIKGIDYEGSNADVMEALKLIEALDSKGILSSKESVEITLGPEHSGLSMNMDGELFRVGYGRYAEKFQSWKDLEPEIRKRGIEVEYVDLRFVGKVVLKPFKTVKKGRS